MKNNDIENRVAELVKETFSKMIFSKKFSNQATLSNKCTKIIYNEWGIGSDYIWKIVDKNIKQFIPNELD